MSKRYICCFGVYIFMPIITLILGWMYLGNVEGYRCHLYVILIILEVSTICIHTISMIKVVLFSTFYEMQVIVVHMIFLHYSCILKLFRYLRMNITTKRFRRDSQSYWHTGAVNVWSILIPIGRLIQLSRKMTKNFCWDSRCIGRREYDIEIISAIRWKL